MTRQPAPAHAVDVITLDFDGQTLVYHRRTGEVHRLDPVGSIVWQVLDGQTTVEDLVDDLSVAFAVDPDAVRADVTDLLTRLGQAFLLADRPTPERRVEPVLLTNPPSP